jgi:formamidopyrimidine-DNA glycosylase
MDEAFGVPEFARCLQGRRQAIKGTLMDQSRMAGIGNTYSDEILFQARINPAIPAGDLDSRRTGILFHAMREVLSTAIKLDPTTEDFRDRLPEDYLLPHRHPGGLCPRDGTELRQLKLAGHTTTCCPKCQV